MKNMKLDGVAGVVESVARYLLAGYRRVLRGLLSILVPGDIDDWALELFLR